jgi:hypothetical protein
VVHRVPLVTVQVLLRPHEAPFLSPYPVCPVQALVRARE